MSYPLEFTANQQEMLGRPGWPFFSDAEDSNCDRESLQSSAETELAPEPQSIGGKIKKKMPDGRTVEAPLRQAVDVGRLHGRKTSPVWRFFRKFDPPLKNGHNVECLVSVTENGNASPCRWRGKHNTTDRTKGLFGHLKSRQDVEHNQAKGGKCSLSRRPRKEGHNSRRREWCFPVVAFRARLEDEMDAYKKLEPIVSGDFELLH